MNKSGPGSEFPITLPELFRNTCLKQEDKPSLFIERKGIVFKWSWNQYFRDVMCFAKAMMALGITERSSINIMGHNSPEWVISFLGSISYNCVASGVYPTNNS